MKTWKLVVFIGLVLVVFTGCSDVIEFTVTFDKQEGFDGTDSVKVAVGSAMPHALAPILAGFSFGGYYDAENGGGNQYYTASMASARSWDKTAATTLYAKWTNAYAINYDANGATGGTAPAVGTKLHDINYNISANTGNLVKTGYAFSGWNTQADGSGTDYATDDIYSANAASSLYAKWIATITFDDQSATTRVDPVFVTVLYTSESDTIASLPTPPHKIGASFGGWYTQTNGRGIEFNASTPVTGDITVYAKWKHTVTFDDREADTSVDPASKTVLYTTGTDTVGSLPTPPVKRGDTFGGWYTEVKGEGTEFNASTPLSGDITVYAKWIPDYVPGDTGPAGGIVFHDQGKYRDAWRFMEAAPSDITTEFDAKRSYLHIFGLYRTEPVGDNLAVGTGTEIGTGKANTEALVNAMGTTAYYVGDDSDVNTEYYAARTCSLYEYGVYDDWFLPSRDELNAMYENLHHREVPIGNFTDTYYWSSSEYPNAQGFGTSQFYVCIQSFQNGGIVMNPRQQSMLRVRPARVF